MNISQVLTKLKALIYSKTETDSLLGGKANSSHTHTKSQITDFPSYGNTAGTICQGNDARLSDARTPTSHTHTKSQITDFPTIPSKTSQLTNDSGFLNYSVKNKTGIGSLGYVNDATDNVLITSNTLAYWDGAYSGTTSNLTYCKKGAFGDIVTHNASEFLSVTRGSSISTGGGGYWAAMCNSSETGSPTLPTTNQWWHVLSMDWSGNSNNVTDWCSQLALPTQQNSCLYWRRNNSGGTSINSSTWHKVIDDTNIGSQSVNYANSAGSAGSVAWGNVSGKPSTFTPSSHTHTKSQITDFPTIPSKTSQLTNDSGFLTSHQSLVNYVTQSNLSTALSDKLDRIDRGYKHISGDGNYLWCKLATITIKSAYINNPISFEITGRERARSIVQIIFENINSTDPSLSLFMSDANTEFYIKKVATSKWELYGHYSEYWGNFTLYRVTTSLSEGQVAVDTTLSNLSSEPSGTTRVSTYLNGYRIYVG